LSHYKKTLSFGNHQLTLETGEIARQASGAVMVSLDDTVVLVTVVGRKDAKPEQDFFPLTVDYQNALTPAARSPAVSSNAKAAQAKGDTDVAPDRQAAAPAVPGKFLQRSADRRDGDVLG